MKNGITYSSTDLINNHRIYSDYLQIGIDVGCGTGDLVSYLSDKQIKTITTSAGMGSMFQEMHVFLY